LLFAGNNDNDHISEEVLNSLAGQIIIGIDTILYRSSAKIHFPVENQFIYNIFHVCVLVGSLSKWLVESGIHMHTPQTILLFCG
jgi:hypothetical protein